MTPPRILQVNTLDREGGAEAIAWSLFQAYRARGLAAWLAVGVKKSADPDVLVIRHDQPGQPAWRRALWRAQAAAAGWHGRLGGWGEKLRRGLAALAEPRTLAAMWRGHESAYFPGTANLLALPPQPPDILHLHSLQRGYFDLAALPGLSQRVPTVLTLHDAWLLSGHCTHSFGCERWQTGCGQCPDLTIPPALWRDGTAHNWRRKAEVFARSRLWVVTPSQWLMDKVQRSLLRPVAGRVIANGINRAIFSPGDQAEARRRLGWPQATRILLFVAHRARRNPWKDYALLEAALARLGQAPGAAGWLAVGVGDTGPETRLGALTLRWAGYQRDPAQLALCYRAADVYVHPARADTFPTVVLEALACGTPVVATRVGGIPEQIQEGVTGYTTPPGEAAALAERLYALLTDDAHRRALGAAAAQAAAARFDLDRMVTAYLALYAEMRQAAGHG